MSFLDEIAKLQQDISKYLTIHNNPDDTSKHEPFAKKLVVTIPTLEKAAPSPSKKTITNAVGKGATNDYNDVKLVQELLDIKADGHCGPKTVLTIKKFQHSLGFKKADGRIDPGGTTWKNLSKKIAPTPVPVETPTQTKSDSPSETTASEIKASVGHKGVNNSDDATLVQQLLGIDADGKVGRGTIRAIAQFQQSLGSKKPDGRIDPNGFTWKALSKKGAPSTPSKPDDAPKTTEPDAPIEEALSTTSKIKKSVGVKGVNLPEDVLLVRILLNKFGANLPEEATADDKLYEAIKKFQKEYRGSSKPDGRVDANGGTWGALLGIARIKGELASFSKKYSVEPAVILAIQAVESGGNGFMPDGRPKILFEGHIFWRELKKAGKDPAALRAGNENIIYPKWVKTNYKYNEKEYDRLALAEKIDKTAALKSASWGEFQIMGFNYASAGFSDVASFVDSMYKPGVNQLGGLMGFLEENRLLRHVQGASKNWAALAKGYNGPAYAKNKYDVKLESAYARFSKITS
jgi:peptidoglycan hydrolase-like protein with peptidoglycan-binding domain